jgi:hypothetical protein
MFIGAWLLEFEALSRPPPSETRTLKPEPFLLLQREPVKAPRGRGPGVHVLVREIA